MAVALLGVLKAGGAYVPLDAGYPEERLRYMVEDAGVKVVVTEAPLRRRLPRRGRWRCCWMDADWADWRRSAPIERPPSGARPENLAYVIYTSGSTGRPKGVAVPHRGVVRLVRGGGWARPGRRRRCCCN